MNTTNETSHNKTFWIKYLDSDPIGIDTHYTLDGQLRPRPLLTLDHLLAAYFSDYSPAALSQYDVCVPRPSNPDSNDQDQINRESDQLLNRQTLLPWLSEGTIYESPLVIKKKKASRPVPPVPLSRSATVNESPMSSQDAQIEKLRKLVPGGKLPDSLVRFIKKNKHFSERLTQVSRWTKKEAKVFVDDAGRYMMAIIKNPLLLDIGYQIGRSIF
jgi:hypothetical protein